MAIWYVNPDASLGGTNAGTSYANAWQGWSAIVWGAGGVSPSDTLYMCNAFVTSASLAVGAHGATTDATRVTIRGDYAGHPGTISFSGASWFDATRNWTTLCQITINSTAAGYNCIYISAASGFTVDHCILTGGDAGVAFGSATAFNSATVSNCVMTGQAIAGINQSLNTASITSQNISIFGNAIHDTSLYGIQLSIGSAAWTTSQLVNYLILNNTVYNTLGPSIYLRTCNNDTTTLPTIYSSGLVVSGNSVRNCGTVAGANGNHGGLLVMGFSWPIITNNIVRNCYVTGAGIQTSKNINAVISFNTVSGIRSGTPTGSFQNGFPIDGNGIFFDDLTVGGLAFGNHISDLISTGDPNSGCGLAFWTANGAAYVGNIVENCNRGVFYGRSEETGNQVYNNTFINCNVGVWKVGTSALTGNITVKNNIFHNCSAGFSAGANPGITADYNCIYGAMNNYIGITAGANDMSVHPQLDADYRPQAAALKRSGVNLGGKDFYGKQFYQAPNIGAVDDMTSTPRYALRDH